MDRGVVVPLRLDDVSQPLAFGEIQCLELPASAAVASSSDAVAARTQHGGR